MACSSKIPSQWSDNDAVPLMPLRVIQQTEQQQQEDTTDRSTMEAPTNTQQKAQPLSFARKRGNGKWITAATDSNPKDQQTEEEESKKEESAKEEEGRPTNPRRGNCL